MIIRLYTGEDGQAQFEDLNMPAGEAETVALKSGGEMIFRSFRMAASAIGTPVPSDSTSSSFPVKWRSVSEMGPNAC